MGSVSLVRVLYLSGIALRGVECLLRLDFYLFFFENSKHQSTHAKENFVSVLYFLVVFILYFIWVQDFKNSKGIRF